MFHISEEVRSADSLVERVCHFFMSWNNICFFYSSGKIQLYKHDLKIISSGLHIDGPHTFIIGMLTLS